MPGDVVVNLPLVSLAELVSGRGPHRRYRRVVADVVPAVGRLDAAGGEEVGDYPPPARVIRLLT